MAEKSRIEKELKVIKTVGKIHKIIDKLEKKQEIDVIGITMYTNKRIAITWDNK